MAKRDNTDFTRQNGVVTDRTEELDVFITCNNCMWRDDYSKNLSAARKAAHRHIQANPTHEVEAHQEKVYFYKHQ